MITMFNEHFFLILILFIIFIFIIVIMAYKNIVQKSIAYKKKLGKVNTFFVKIFKIGILDQIYIDLYRSLKIWQKAKLPFIQKKIYIDCSKKISNEFGISLEYCSNEIRCYINPKIIHEANIKEEEVKKLLSKVFRGSIDLIVVNVYFNTDKSNMEDLSRSINDGFDYIYSYLSGDFSYILNVMDQDNSILYQRWNSYHSLSNNDSFWLNEKPSSAWVNKILTKNTDAHLSLDDVFDTNQIKELYCFLESCMNLEYMINLLQSKSYKNIAKYKGFGFGLEHNNKKIMSEVKLTRTLFARVKKYTIHSTLVGATFMFILGWYSVSDNIKRASEQIFLYQNQNNYLKSINLTNYRKELNKVFDKNYFIKLAYYNGVKNELDRSWDNLIRNKIILNNLEKSNSSVQILALNILMTKMSDYNVKKSISNNLWIWSKITRVPQNILKIWLAIKHPSSSDKDFNEFKFDRNKDIKILDKIKYFNTSIFTEQKPLEKPLDKLIINKSLELEFVDNVLESEPLLESLKLGDVLIMSNDEKKSLNIFVKYLEFRELLELVAHEESIRSRLVVLSKISKQIGLLIESSEDVKLANFLFQSIAEKFDVGVYENEKYYNYNFYADNLELVKVMTNKVILDYKSLGLDLGSIDNVLNSSLFSYKQKYNEYFYHKIERLFYVANSYDLNSQIHILERVGSSVELSETLKLVHSNAIDANYFDVNSLYKNTTEFNNLIKRYLDILYKAKTNPQTLIGLYKDSNKPFQEDMDRFIDKNIGQSNKIAILLSELAMTLDELTSNLLRNYIQEYWSLNIEKMYNLIFESFPFNKDAISEITPRGLEKIIGVNGSLNGDLSNIEPLIDNSNLWLTDKQLGEYKKIKKLTNLLWDNQGKPKPVKVKVTTSELLPKYKHLESSWYFFKEEKSYYYDGVLLNDENTISDIGVGGISQDFEIKWWKDKASSIILIDNKKNLVDQKVSNGYWSFWKLLKYAQKKDKIFAWNFNNESTQIVFEIENSDFELN
ncbi:hypothetical protein LA02_1237 [Francisella philomiragia]|uniref:hypothetical protein n=1 Tax=Francisella philomiragia TaxID=28110 RepID=UPI0005A56E55|nr:hypothetical protein [Francisella philomiragia]AJI56362.1 hypothetical protein LA02_1237 [Francisella philomiragia]